jgi:hypothetical protein
MRSSNTAWVSLAVLGCLVTSGCFSTTEIWAADPVVGLYYPDFRAMRQLIGPKGIPNVPAGEDHDEISLAWRALFDKGQELLLQERDLALLVVDSNGNWLYRTSGVHSLKSLHMGDTAQNRADHDNLQKILRNPLFLALRDFFNELLFARATSSKRLGVLIASVDNLPAGQAQKDWFRSIVGAEIMQMDNVDQQGLLLDKDYGAVFVNALTLAKAQRRQRLEIIARYLKDGADESVGICSVALYSPSQGNDYPVAGHMNLVTLAGKKIWEINSHTGTVYVAAKDDKWATSGVTGAFRRGDLAKYLKDGRFLAYVALPGTQKVYEINTDQDE